MDQYNKIKEIKSEYSSWLKIPIRKNKNYLNIALEYVWPRHSVLNIGGGKTKVKCKNYKVLDIDNSVNPDYNYIEQVNGKFDIILMIEVIEHVNNELFFKWIDKAKEILNPGGKIIITTPNVNYLKVHEYTHKTFYKPFDLEKILRFYGFKVELYRYWNIPKNPIKKIIKSLRHPFTFFLEIDLNCEKIIVVGERK